VIRRLSCIIALAAAGYLLASCSGGGGSTTIGTMSNAPSSTSQRTLATAIFGNRRFTPVPSFAQGLLLAETDPTLSPPGANIPGCKLTAAHPFPVVLVHGTLEDMEDNFGAISPILANNGYCVFVFNYGGATPESVSQGTGPIATSAKTVAAFVKQVIAQTGASHVDLVGHSQGGMLLEYIAKLEGEAPNIHSLVALDPSTHGTTVEGLTTLAKKIPASAAIIDTLLSGSCQACLDQEVGSAALAPLDAPPIAQPGPTYTVIETETDEVVTPPGSAFINEPGVTNEFIQNFCPSDVAEHLNTPYDLVTIQLILNALSPSTAQTPNCSLEFPVAP
jgi:pimeloyl-ACP methyl ester carboxylesterase